MDNQSANESSAAAPTNSDFNLQKWQLKLMLRIINISSLMSNQQANPETMTDAEKYSILQKEDLGDVLLRTVLGFL
jgi:hypothetical protein